MPEHPLFAKGYKSIGCAPCTTIVAEGEDPRAGRWRGLNKKECGIHFDFNGAIAKPVANVERNLWKDGAFIADPFRAWAEGDDPGDGALHPHSAGGVPRQPRGGAEPIRIRSGLLVSPGDKVEDVAADLGALRLDRDQLPGLHRWPRLFDARGC